MNLIHNEKVLHANSLNLLRCNVKIVANGIAPVKIPISKHSNKLQQFRLENWLLSFGCLLFSLTSVKFQTRFIYSLLKNVSINGRMYSRQGRKIIMIENFIGCFVLIYFFYSSWTLISFQPIHMQIDYTSKSKFEFKLNFRVPHYYESHENASKKKMLHMQWLYWLWRIKK